MSHISIAIPNSVEIINMEPTEISPLISKCQIKVCYVGDEPNRNKSIITKDVAQKIAPTLRGCPIVGFYNEDKQDFGGHDRTIEISGGKIEIKDITKPYGFVDINASVWFQKFTDDGIEHEYLVTEGYIWTGQYKEAQRIVDKGNNQSMELDEETLDAYWTKDVKGHPQFFIINEAIIENLCILGEDVEPCFEGASIAKVQFSFDDETKQSLNSFVEQMKKIIDGGKTPMYVTYAVEIGGSLWDNLYKYLIDNYPDPNDSWCSIYCIEGIYEEDAQKFAILRNREDGSYHRLNFILNDADGFVPEADLTEVEKTFVPVEVPQFDPAAVEAYAAKLKEQMVENIASTETEFTTPDTEEELTEPANDEVEYSLEENAEYIELKAKFEAATTSIEQLTASLNEANETINNLNKTIDSLSQFKLDIERKEKEKMINETFYMLDDEYKKDIVENIDSYSLDDIEAKLSVICVRNRINMNIEDTNSSKAHTTYNLSTDNEDFIPAWVKAARNVEKNLNK